MNIFQNKIDERKKHTHGFLAIPSIVLLLLTTLGSTTLAQGRLWGFNLQGAPTAVNQESSTGEFMRLTGSGLFDTTLHKVIASGSFSIFGAFDESPAGLFRGTWVATDLGSFAPAGGPSPGLQGGTLTITTTFNFSAGFSLSGIQLTVVCPYVNGAFQESNDAIIVQLEPDETFTKPPGGSGGFTIFHLLSP